jgi:hypothetical protein
LNSSNKGSLSSPQHVSSRIDTLIELGAVTLLEDINAIVVSLLGFGMHVSMLNIGHDTCVAYEKHLMVHRVLF